MALAGPVIMTRLDPNRAATRQGNIAAYRPYWGGMPASVANAMPCGRTTIAPVMPARISARSTPGVRSSGAHSRKGRKRARPVARGAEVEAADMTSRWYA